MAIVAIQVLFVLALHAVVVWSQLGLRMTKSCQNGYSLEYFNASTTTTNFSVYNNNDCGISPSDTSCYNVNTPAYLAVTAIDTSFDSKVSRQVVANISWRLKRGDAVPEIFLLLVKFLPIDPSNGVCVFFNSSIFGQNSNEIHRKFHFDCLSPTDGVLVEVLGYTARRSQRQCPPEVRRKLCMQLFNQGCQQIYLHSKATSQKRVCSCHKSLSMRTNYTSDETFQVVFNNLPPFLERLLIEIVDESNASNSYEKELREPIDENFTFLTDKTFKAGNYSIHVKTYCGREYDKPVQCGDGILHLMSFITVPQGIAARSQAQPYETAISVMASVIASGIVTALIFCALQVYRKYHRHSHQFLPEDKVNNRKRNLDDQNYLQEQQPLNKQLKENVGTENNVTIPVTPDKIITLKQMSHHSSMLQYYHDHPNNQRTWMLVYHSDNKDHKQKIDKICSELSQHGLRLSCGSSVNWPDFAELAAEKFRDIIMVVSEGLCGLCHDYMLRIQSNNAILEQRNFEIIPCVVMHKLRCLIHEDPKRTDFMLHIVSVEKDEGKGQALVDKFFNDHPFIKRTTNYNVYQWGDLM